MKVIIDYIMVWSNTTEKELEHYKTWLDRIVK